MRAKCVAALKVRSSK